MFILAPCRGLHVKSLFQRLAGHPFKLLEVVVSTSYWCSMMPVRVKKVPINKPLILNRRKVLEAE